MLNFIHWLALNRPHIRSLRSLSEQELIFLVDDFEEGKLQANPHLRDKWIVGFQELLRGDSNWEGYDVARQELRGFENTR